MKKEIVIYQPWGGIGDNLAHSVIPELCNKYGIKCYLSEHNHCRNSQIYNLIWKLNPFIQSVPSPVKDFSWIDQCKNYEIPGRNHIQVIQRIHGFDEDHEYPKIYYKPNYLPEFKNVTILDLNAISVGYDRNVLRDKVTQLLEEKNIKDNIVDIVHSKVADQVNYDTHTNKTLDINDLFLYCDIIHSCKRVITLNSGITNLASTIKNQFNTDTEIYTFTLRRYMKESGTSGYFYSNNNYIAVD